MTGATRRRVLLTGASGYVGRAAARALVAMGHEVHALGRTDPAIAGVTFHSADLLGAEPLAPAIAAAGADHLLHLAWSVTPGRFWTDLGNCDWVGASLRLFRAFAESGSRRIVGVGSCAEYAWTGSPLDEVSSPVRPATLYGTAKASLWQMLEALGRQEGLSVAWGRLFFLYGPGEPRGKLVADAIVTLLEGRRFETSPGLQRRDFLHVDDAGRALAGLLASPVTGPVNIASGHCGPVREVIAEVARVTGGAGLVDFGARAMAPGEPAEIAAVVTRLRDEVGFMPEHGLASGIEQAVAWWRAHSGGVE
ncbi:NAD(P)-dependent oxidoreductase [Novosphingobium flavum]|uniref:NAD-dependent epimerase/dehydratase family protein n=1 Tax=Novosphingobium aerophilum TaxID=2839843 RepID=UPI001639C93C|nr:NAD(P)-dependent oxidoreductase [Novosphingobium aerophilum]MBC2661989.1 NAD(P)-dependent oxidoreductase [Novosphingobium aerophilum]